MKSLRTLVCFISLLFLIACGEDDSTLDTPVRLALAPALFQGEGPYTLTVTVTGAGMEEMTAETVFTGKQARLEFAAIPSGPRRTFTVEVRNQSGRVLYTGTTTKSLFPGKPVTVSIPMNRTSIPLVVEVTSSGFMLPETYTLTIAVTGEGIEETETETDFTGTDARINLDVPFGNDHTFTAKIKDKNGNVLYSGTTTQSLIPGTSVTVVQVSVSPLNSGNLKVVSTPSGAKVFLNGRDTGVSTPHLFKDLPGGTYKVELKSVEYRDWVKFVQVGNSKTVTIEAEMVSIPPVVIFHDDFSSGLGNWKIYAQKDGNPPPPPLPTNSWQLCQGALCFLGDAVPEAQAFWTTHVARTRSTIDLNGFASAKLSFGTAYNVKWGDTIVALNFRDMDEKFITTVYKRETWEATEMAWKEITVPLDAKVLGKSVYLSAIIYHLGGHVTLRMPDLFWRLDDIKITGIPQQ